jgi:methylsterol monooxygenase
MDPAADKPAQYKGKQHKWAERAATRVNMGLMSLTPTIVVIAFSIYINKTVAAKTFYIWLNHNYTPFQINAWWSFAITSAVYWAGGLIFMVIDLFKPAVFHKYKIQPAQSISPGDYRRVCWIVLRNQVIF